MEDFNVSAFLAINQYAGKNDLVDAVIIGAAELTPYLFILVLLALWFSADPGRRKSSFIAGCSVLVGLLISYVVSLFYFHPRPFMQKLGTNLVSHAPDTSFPSDHTTFIFSIAIFLLLDGRTRKLGGVLCLLSLVGGVSRVYVGVHFPLDILGAAAVGGGSSLFVLLLFKKTRLMQPVLDRVLKIKLPGKRPGLGS
jgi:undecaprenyl-diphosphatase